MELKMAFGQALKEARTNKALSQESFSGVSGRTYLSALERGLKNPTIEKVGELARVMDLHPLSVLTLCYLHQDPDIDIGALLERVRIEVESLWKR